MPPTRNQQNEDFLARERVQLTEFLEGQRVHNTDFYKQIMTLSVAGLGFNLTVDAPKPLEISFPLNAWGYSIVFFFMVIILTLLVFFLTAWHLRVQTRIHNRYTDHTESDTRWDKTLAVLKKIAALASVLFFGAAMWMTISRLVAWG